MNKSLVISTYINYKRYYEYHNNKFKMRIFDRRHDESSYLKYIKYNQINNYNSRKETHPLTTPLLFFVTFTGVNVFLCSHFDWLLASPCTYLISLSLCLFHPFKKQCVPKLRNRLPLLSKQKTTTLISVATTKRHKHYSRLSRNQIAPVTSLAVSRWSSLECRGHTVLSRRYTVAGYLQ